MINLLLEKGADINAGTWREASFPQYSRAVHLCVSSGNDHVLDALRPVIEAGADLNARNAQGCTALMLACRVDEEVKKIPASSQALLEAAKALLKAGACVDLVDNDGRSALHYAAYLGSTEIVEMLLSKGSLSTLNLPDNDRKMPLTVAVEFDHPEAVSLLLSAGASQRDVKGADTPCPFRLAVVKRHEKALRILASEKGLEAVGGGEEVIPASLTCATFRGSSRILRLVLLAEGEDRQQHWARHRMVLDFPMISLAAAFGVLANVNVLLAAGAHELECDSKGRVAGHNIGTMAHTGEPDQREVAAIGRALQRGPAFRARSWAWPAAAEKKASDRARSASAPKVEIVRLRDPQIMGRLTR